MPTITVAKETTAQEILGELSSIVQEGGGIDFSPLLPKLVVTGTPSASYSATDGSNTVTGTLNSEGRGTIIFTNPGTWLVKSGTYRASYTMKLGECRQINLLISSVLNNNSWSDIRAVSDAGTASSYWSVGDTKRIVINGTVGSKTYSNLSIDAFIIGFNHNAAIEGRNRIHFQIGKINGTLICLDEDSYEGWQNSEQSFCMNVSNSNSGGWEYSGMRINIMGSNGTPSNPTSNSLMAALPSDLRAVMKSVTKYTDNVGNYSTASANVTSTNDYLFLLSPYEVYADDDWSANEAERGMQQQYAYYVAGNSKIAYKQSESSTPANWWCRSPTVTTDWTFGYVWSGVSSSNSVSAGRSYGVSAAFCV